MRTALLVAAIWLLFAGIALFIPPIGAAVFAYPVQEPELFSGWGVAVLMLGVITLLIAQDLKQYGRLVWVLIVGFLLTSADMLYYWVTGAYTTRTALPTIAVNVALAVWIWFSRPKA